MSDARDDAMQAEFDTVARWTERVVADLGLEYAIPAACRGSGSPGALRWLGDAMGIDASTRLLDDGAGLGGPAAFIAEEFGIRPVLVEPMIGACQAARRLFGLPTVAAEGGRLPFPDATFDAALSLGVLCTTKEKLALLEELRRVVRPGGALGLLAFVKTSDDFEPPEGNDFPSDASLRDVVDDAGFSTIAEVGAAAFAKAPPDWDRKAARVEHWLSTQHASDPGWVLASHQQDIITSLLRGGTIVARLIHARRR